jgi:hypothetical protein
VGKCFTNSQAGAFPVAKRFECGGAFDLVHQRKLRSTGEDNIHKRFAKPKGVGHAASKKLAKRQLRTFPKPSLVRFHHFSSMGSLAYVVSETGGHFFAKMDVSIVRISQITAQQR